MRRPTLPRLAAVVSALAARPGRAVEDSLSHVQTKTNIDSSSVEVDQELSHRHGRAYTSSLHLRSEQALDSSWTSTWQSGAEFGRARAAMQELALVRRRLQDMASLPNTLAKRQVLINYGDVQYVSHFRIGRQTIVGILDTGSFELVVFSKQCKSCGAAAKYDPNLSGSHLQGKLVTMQSYGSGDTYSSQAFDMCSVGPYPEKNQSFWEVVGAKMPILTSSAFEAIIGIGPPETPASDAWQDAQDALNNVSIFYSNGRKPQFSVVKQAKDNIEAALEVSGNPTMLDNFAMGSFSLCLGAQPGSDGFLIWNDTSAFDNPGVFKRIPVTGHHTWSVVLSNVSLNMWNEMEGQTPAGEGRDQPFACSEGCTALMDSGTSLLAVPSSIINWLSTEMVKLNADCSNIHVLPDLVFTLGKHRFFLPPDAYIAEVKGTVPQYLQSYVRVHELQVDNKVGGRQCQLLLMESFADGANGPFWILGMPFFRKYYSTFFLGDSANSRALYVAPASEDCTPVSYAKASLARSRPYLRRIDPNKVHVSNTVMAARSQKFVRT